MEIYLCRHGETNWAKTGRHTGLTDVELTEVGRNQAKKLGERLKGGPFKKVLTSPLKRAKETAELAGFEAEEDPDLVEWNYGGYEGKTRDEIGKEWRLFRDGAPGGESVEQVKARADRFLKKLKLGPVVIFSHGHFCRALAARWIGQEIIGGERLFLSVASISILGLEHEQKVIRLWNSTDHLESL